MAKPPTAEKKREPASARTTFVLPTQLRIGDLLTDETGEWEIIAFVVCGRPGTNVHARMKKVGHPGVTEIRTLAAHERVNVKRARA